MNRHSPLKHSKPLLVHAHCFAYTNYSLASSRMYEHKCIGIFWMYYFTATTESVEGIQDVEQRIVLCDEIAYIARLEVIVSHYRLQ